MNNQLRIKNSDGFTLLEVLVYITLLGIIFSGAITSAFTISQLSGRNQTAVMLQTEGQFLIGKINWLLSNVETINLPIENTSGSTLSVDRIIDTILTTFLIQQDSSVGGNIQIRRGLLPPNTLNNSSVVVSDLIFKHFSSTGAGSGFGIINTNFTLTARTPSGQLISRDFTSVNYVYTR